MSYTFNGCGDYMFLATNDKRFQIQVRFSQAVGPGLGTVISAVVIKQEGVSTIQVNHNKNGKYMHCVYLRTPLFYDCITGINQNGRLLFVPNTPVL